MLFLSEHASVVVGKVSVHLPAQKIRAREGARWAILSGLVSSGTAHSPHSVSMHRVPKRSSKKASRSL